MDCVEPFKRGHLFTPPQGRLLKRTWQRKYYALYRASNLGIERVEVFDSEESYQRHGSNKLICLNDCIKVVQAPQKHQHNVFEVICKSQTYQFSAETTQQLAEWIGAFQTVAFGCSQRRESFQTLPMAPPMIELGDVDNQQEENTIYSSMNGPEVYTVEISDTEASRRCSLQGSYDLVITPVHITLKCACTGKLIYTWPYRHIRRFSREKGIFSFEAGRKCATGEGLLSFRTTEWNTIYSTVGVYVKLYKGQCDTQSSTRSFNFSLSSSSTTSCGDITKPLPPAEKQPPESKSTATSNVKPPNSALPPIPNEENIYENTAQPKMRPPITKPPRKNKLNSVSNMSNSSESIHNQVDVATAITDQNPAAKPLKGGNDANDSVFESPPEQKTDEIVYDEPEERKDAWKTFAHEKDNIHTENIALGHEHGPMYASVDVTTLSSTRSGPLLRNLSAPDGSPVPHQISVIAPRLHGSDSSYDHLFQYNSQPPHVSPNPNHIYKKLGEVSVIAASADCVYKSVQDEYKSPVPVDEYAYTDPVNAVGPNPDPAAPVIHHVILNEDEYSVVVKPKKNGTPS